MKNKGLRLTQKTAKALIQRELNLSASRLKTERAEGGVYIYKMTLGRFEITVENDWFERNGLYVLEISSGTGEAMRLYYDPDTLEENCEAEDKNRAEKHFKACGTDEKRNKTLCQGGLQEGGVQQGKGAA